MSDPARWRTWAGDESCVPAVRRRPGSVTEVVDAVGRAAAAGQTLRVAGAGHSFTPAVLTDGTLLSLERMDRVLDVDTATGLVRTQAGISLNALSRALWGHGRALENLGDVDVQSIAGATATGTHGTGARLPNLSAALESIELVAGDGTVHELGACDADGGTAWRAARVSVGALGVITAVTLRTVPAFVLRGLDAVEGREQVLDELDARAAAHDHFELFAFPYCPRVITRTNDRTQADPRPRGRVGTYVRDELLTNKGFEAICRLGRARPSLIPRLNRAATALGGASAHTDRSYRVFATPRSVRFNELEYAIPREHAATAVRAVLSMIEERRVPISFPLEVRTVAPDDALLSPAGGRDTAYVAAHVFQGMEWQPFLREVEAIMRAFDGRPHWGKRHFRTAADLAPAYPGWDAFQAVRDRLDPGRRFTNPYVAQVLGA
ncbi:MAG: FAD-linked oxidoreductase [Solirubrobacterales bacterium]|nr:FAD-linked oxidoreductase [Solirubrobacterales bacterium]